MLWADRLPRFSGLVLLLLCLGIIISTALGSNGDNDPFARGDAKGFLQDIDDKRTMMIFSIMASVCVDGILGILAAAMLFSLFRDRAGALAIGALALIIGAGAVLMVGDGISVVL